MAYTKVKTWRNLLLNKSLRSNRRQYNLEYDLNCEFIQYLFDKQDGRCYWLNIPMIITGSKNHPLQISLDRLDNSKGYTKDNVVLSTLFCNRGRNSTTVDEFKECIEEIKASIKNEI